MSTVSKINSSIPGIPAECNSTTYIELNETNRYWSYDDGSSAYYCDSDTIVSDKWYRFTGAAGTMMAPYCIPKRTCNTYQPLWLNGAHPSVVYQSVARTACGHYSSSCCYRSYSVVVQNCSGFYVYRLRRPSGCHQRYCGVNGKCVYSVFQ